MTVKCFLTAYKYVFRTSRERNDDLHDDTLIILDATSTKILVSISLPSGKRNKRKCVFPCIQHTTFNSLPACQVRGQFAVNEYQEHGTFIERSARLPPESPSSLTCNPHTSIGGSSIFNQYGYAANILFYADISP
ncbi:hypothetical protein J6590_018829 [Homalodisca vitripennis]|nr:hypothetical protein J6590_018829 [Homalodisca vitripennis]